MQECIQGHLVTQNNLKHPANLKENYTMSEVIVIEAVSDKFKNKYSAGSIKAGGKWMQVSSKLNLSDFQKDSQVTVETKTNDKGYTSVVGLLRESLADKIADEINEEINKTIVNAQVEAKTKTAKRVVKEDVSRSYDDTKSRKILVQGITQSCIASASLAGLPYTNVSELAANIKALALEMIEFVADESK